MRLHDIQVNENTASRDRNHGVEHEVNNFAIYIHDLQKDIKRLWGIKPGKGPDGSPEQKRAQDNVDAMCKRKSTEEKKWSWKLTSQAATLTEKQISMPTTFSPGDEVRVKGHPELQGVLIKLLADNAALVNFEIGSDHAPVKSEVDVADLEPATLHENKLPIDDDIHNPDMDDEEFEEQYGMSREIAKQFRAAATDKKNDRWTEHGDPIHEKLDANQRRAGQAGPMYKAPLRGTLVGGDATEEDLAEGSDFFTGSKFADEDGNTFSVEKIIAFAKKNPKYFHKDFPLSKIKHDLSWWQGNKERMMNADTSFPLLVIQNDDGHLSVADGLNRMKKAVDVEEKQTIDVYLVPKKDIMKFSEKQGVAEGLPSSLSKSDYTPGATQKHVNTNCTTCHGRKVMYKLNGKLFADNKVGAVRVKCPTCHGTGDKQDVAEGDVFFIEMGNTLIETTVLRANHDTVLLAADDATMAMLDASSIMEAEYHGRKVPLGKPMQGDVKKFKVYVKDPKTGNVKKVNFGDPNMRIKKSNPARRKSFRARHNCANPGPRTKARYWSCRKW